MTPRANEKDWISRVFDPIFDRLTNVAVNVVVLFVVFCLLCVIVTYAIAIYQHASAWGWYAVQFAGIEGPGFVVALVIVTMLPWVRNQLRKES
jgi:hypothetical protein